MAWAALSFVACAGLGARAEREALAAAAERRGDFARAAELWLAELRLDPSNERAAAGAALAKLELADTESAIGILRVARRAVPESPLLFVLESRAFELTGSPGAAAESLAAALSADPKGAAAAARRIVEADRSSVDHLLFGARVARAAGAARDAEAWLTRAAALDPQSIEAHLGLGRLALEAHRLRDAARFLERAVELDPTDAGPLIELADVHSRSGRDERARELLARALEVAPQDRRQDVERRLSELSPEGAADG